MLIVLFLCLQVGNAMHEVHVDESHDEIECTFCDALFEEIEFEPVLTANSIYQPVLDIADRAHFDIIYKGVQLLAHQSRAPPPRGPPLTRI